MVLSDNIPEFDIVIAQSQSLYAMFMSSTNIFMSCMVILYLMSPSKEAGCVDVWVGIILIV